VHDDIIDKATLRRDKPTLWNALGPEQALLIGNLITTRALAIAAKDSNDLCREFLNAYEGVNRAQQHEILQYGHLRNEQKYRDIIIGKTSVMLELALYSGASLSEQWPCNLRDLNNAIREVGIVFQVKDDIEDVEAWLRQDRADRSKAAQFDIDLQNYTLPVTIAAKAAGLPEDVILDSSQMSHVTPKIWKESLGAANEYADKSVAYIHEQLKTAVREMSGGLAARVGEWSENFLEHVQKQSLDEAVKSNVQSKTV
jgi:geranylgeranyl pyrophosphate synthase